MFGAKQSHGAPRDQSWFAVSEPLAIKWDFDFPGENRKRACPRDATDRLGQR
jgi:hypothetical protein